MVEKVKKLMTRMANSNFEEASFDEVDMAEDMPVGEDDWVQWEPEEGFEAHGKVIRVLEPDDEDDELMVDVRMYVQDDDGVWHPTGDVRRKEMDEVGPWGNTPSEDAVSDERLDDIENASPVRKFNPDEDGEDVSDSISDAIDDDEDEEEEEMTEEELISDSQEEAIENKVEEHNEEHGDEEGKKVTKNMLMQVYERGLAAHQDTHRPGMSAQQWSMARVNAFLYLVRNGNPENDAYTQDNDLLPEGHPKKGETESQAREGEHYVPMTEANEEAEQQPEPEEGQEEESLDVEALKQEVVEEVASELKAELADDDEDEEVEDGDVEEAEAEDSAEELEGFEEFRRENPDLELSEAAEQYEQESRGVEDKLDEMAEKIDSLESKLDEKEEEVEELSERVNDPQRATQVSDDAPSPREEVSELSDRELTEKFAENFIGSDGVSLERGVQ
jgi:predicted DNA-binding protein YlxM (UPF0122 family)